MNLPTTRSTIGPTNCPSISWEKRWPSDDEIFIPIPTALLSCFDEYLGHHVQSANDRDFSELWNDDALDQIQLKIAEDWILWLRSKLRAGPGFCCLSFPEGRYDETQMRIAYFLIARELGQLDRRYGYLFDVTDRGLDYTREAIPVSKTSAATSFHTDSTALDYAPDIIGLLCIHPAMTGGESRLANAADLYHHLTRLKSLPAELLSQPIMRDVITPGKEQNIEAISRNRFPLFSFDRFGLRFRYMRFWIEQAYAKTYQEIPRELIEVMNAIDNYLENEDHIYRLTLKRGDIAFINNAFLCHDRTAFIDHDDPRKKRTLVRTWIGWPSKLSSTSC